MFQKTKLKIISITFEKQFQQQKLSLSEKNSIGSSIWSNSLRGKMLRV